MLSWFQKPQHNARERVAKGAVLLDVRTPQEFEGGHIPGAKNIPVQELPERLHELDGFHSVVVYCRSGARSATASGMLKKAGHEVLDIGAIGNW